MNKRGSGSTGGNAGFGEEKPEPPFGVNHERIAAQLEAARNSIAQGRVAELEPLDVLLREARRAGGK